MRVNFFGFKRGINHMAKDGTARGGPRIGAGGKPQNKKKMELMNTSFDDVADFVAPDEIIGVDVPPIKEFMKAKQKNGKDLYAEEIFKTTYVWLKKKGCEKLVSNQVIEQYAMAVSRWIQCEEAISEYGFLAKHPTTGNAIASPYVQMSQSYMKQITQIWYQIYQVIRDKGNADEDEMDEQDIMMARLLNMKREN